MTSASKLSDLPRKVDVLGVEVSVVDLPSLLEVLDAAVKERTPLDVSFVNPNYVMRAREDPDLQRRMNSFDVMLADGWGVVLAARLLGSPLPTRLANDDIGPAVFGLSEARRWRTFLFGSAPGVVDRAVDTLLREYRDLPVVGRLHGYWDVLRGHPGWFDPEDDDRIIRTINAAHADVLWVGLPTPIQQRWVTDNRHRLDVPVVITGGSYLDHLAERLQWYPSWVDRARIGWLYRLAQDPRRLWRRYSLELLEYAGVLASEKAARRTAQLVP